MCKQGQDAVDDAYVDGVDNGNCVVQIRCLRWSKEREEIEQVGLKCDEEEHGGVEDSGPGRLDGEDRHYLGEAEPDLDQYKETEAEREDSLVEVARVRRLVAD